MRKCMAKLRSRAGETLVEILVALLIIALASILMVGMYSASTSIDKSARDQDKRLYESLSAVEGGTATKLTTITEITLDDTDTSGKDVTIKVDVYEDGAFTAYRKAVS